MEKLTVVNKSELIPLNTSGEVKYSTLDEYKQLIKRSPSEKWIKTNPYANNAKYLPIRIVEELLDEIFTIYEVEFAEAPKILGNSVVVSVHLKVYHPLLNRFLTYAGTGAVPIEIKSGNNPTDFSKINPKALHKNVPSALSFAISNAAKKIGKLFGSHLNSNETMY